eukprot:COSAG03_NODE_943_length_5248_cov_12.372111_8_plen_64_part_00
MPRGRDTESKGDRDDEESHTHQRANSHSVSDPSVVLEHWPHCRIGEVEGQWPAVVDLRQGGQA